MLYRHHIFPASSAFERWHATEIDGEVTLQKTGQLTPTRSIDLKQRILDRLPADLPHSTPASPVIKLIDVYNGTATLDDFISQLTPNQLAMMTSGGGSCGGTGCYGGVSDAGLTSTYGIPTAKAFDGPSGLRISSAATWFPSGTTLANTWNDELCEELAKAMGKEMLLNDTDTILGPGMNLHRDPRTGRNFEYYSEDPLITGQMASAITRGVQSQGVALTVKHFAANNQEQRRQWNDSRVSERALRELYLKGFEIAIKGAKPQNLMMSYNLVNGVYAHYNYMLATSILRDDWGYDGVVMTDWTIQNASDPDFGNANQPYRVRAGVDVLMPGDQNGTQTQIVAAINAGTLTVGEVQRTARRVLEFAMKSAQFRQENNLPYFDYTPGVAPFTVGAAAGDSPQVDMIYVDGRALAAFDPATTVYTVAVPDGEPLPQVTAIAGTSVRLAIVQGSENEPQAQVTATGPTGAKVVYTLTFTTTTGPGTEVPALLDSLSVDGTPVAGFLPERTDYTVWVADAEEAEVTWAAAPEVSVTETRTGDRVLLKVVGASGQTDYTVTLTHPIATAVRPQSDEFDGTALKSFWSVENPNTATLNASVDGSLSIQTEHYDWYGTATGLRNVVSQPAGGDWTAITRLTTNAMPSANYHQVGVMVYQDSSNYVQLTYKSEGNRRWSRVHETGGAVAQTNVTSDVPTAVGPFLIRVIKKGNTYRFAVARYDVNNRAPQSWMDIGTEVTTTWTNPKFALVAMDGTNGSGPSPIIATYDYVRFYEPNEVGPSLPVSDEFDGTTLDTAVWGVDGTQTADLTHPDGAVQIVTGRGEWNRANANLQNAVFQPAPGDWEATTKMSWSARPGGSWQQIGVMVYDDRDNYAHLMLEYQIETRLTVKAEVAGSNDQLGVVSTRVLPPTGPGEGLFRITKHGFTYKFAASFDGGRTWAYVSPNATQEFVLPFLNPKFALVAIAPGSAPVLTVQYDYVRFAPLGLPTATIYATGDSRVKAYEQAIYLSNGLAPQVSSDSVGEPTALGSHVAASAGTGRTSAYTVDVEHGDYYLVAPRIAASATGDVTVGLSLDGEQLSAFQHSGGTGSNATFQTLPANLVYLPAGTHTLTVDYGAGGFNLNYLVFSRANSTADLEDLADAIAEAKALVEREYTPDSWGYLTAAVSAAEAILVDSSATQGQIDGAEAAVRGAITALAPAIPAMLDVTGSPVVAFTGGESRFPAVATGSAGSWSGVPDALSYQWLRDGEPIADATGVIYALTVDDVGTELTLAVTARTVGQVVGVAVSDGNAIRPGAALAATGAPGIAGTAQVGATLTVEPAEWSFAPANATYQWLADGAAIAGATAATYEVVPADLTKRLSVIETATTAGFEDATVRSAATPAVVAGAPLVFTPAVTGTPTRGETLSVATGVNPPWTAAIQWLRDGTEITGETGPTYALAVADIGHLVSVRVTASLTAYADSVQSTSGELVAAGVADTAALSELVDEANAKIEIRYTTSTWDQFESARDAASALADRVDGFDATVTQGEVDAARVALATALANLDERGNPATLAQVVTLFAIPSSDADLYTAVTWAAYATAVGAATPIAADASDSTQDELDAAGLAVLQAYVGLELKAVQPDVSEQLDGLLTALAALDLVESAFTAASWDTFAEARAEATAVLEATVPPSSQEEVLAALDALHAALSGLIPRADLGELSGVLLAIDELGLSHADYTADSWDAYLDARVEARAVIVAGPDAVAQTRVDAALAGLRAALRGLTAPVSKAGLVAAVEALDALVLESSLYTTATWNAYKLALEAAREARADDDATQGSVDAALAGLLDKAGALRFATIADTSAVDEARAGLDAALRVADSIGAAVHATPASLDGLLTARNRARGLLGDDTATASALTAAALELAAAVSGLIPAVSTTALAALLDASRGFAEADYTTDTWAALSAAQGQATSVLGPNATQSAVDQAVGALRSAIACLRPIVSAASLHTAVMVADGLNLDAAAYTEASWQVYLDALIAARAALAPGTSQADVDHAAEDLKAAAGALARSIPEPTPTVTVAVPGPVPTVIVTVAPAAPAPSAPAPAPTGTTTTPPVTGDTGGIAPPDNGPGAGAIVRVQASQKTVRLVKGKSVRIAGFGYTAAGSLTKVSWSTSKASVAKVSASGKITARKAGTAIVTLKAGGKTAKVKVTVVAKRPSKATVTKVRALGVPKTLAVGKTNQVTGRWTPSTAVGAKVTFKSSKPAVIAVDKTGLLTALAPGVARITVIAGG
ncbi:MAG: FIVAR domain-containing protein, partial [Bifidobacteriaceae bacterium]|nr:FIVAR domain-containing protein [Bifidobacteriaceae bacterium]